MTLADELDNLLEKNEEIMNEVRQFRSKIADLDAEGKNEVMEELEEFENKL